jgi:hypothetical protein
MAEFNPHNPHPLSKMRTELVWDGKYDDFGNRREISGHPSPLPLQLIETIDEPRSRAAAQRNFFDDTIAHRDDFRNRLIWGASHIVTSSMVGEFAGSIQVVYIDPPFDDYALNDHSKIDGVFKAVHDGFRFTGARNLLTRVTAANEFRNTYVAHHQGFNGQKHSWAEPKAVGRNDRTTEGIMW